MLRGCACTHVPERTQLEFGMLDDPLHEFVVGVDTAHIRSADPKTARDFEIVIARCGRSGRGTPGHYFATTLGQSAINQYISSSTFS